jgi:hypothetical protein
LSLTSAPGHGGRPSADGDRHQGQGDARRRSAARPSRRARAAAGRAAARRRAARR